MRRAAFSLIECIIAICLLAIVLTMFSSMFWHYSRFEIMMQKKQESFGLLQMHASQLQDLLAKATYGLDSKFCFYSETGESKDEIGESLVFTYDAGVDPEPIFSNINIGKLFLDKSGNLFLASWSDPKLFKDKDLPMKKELIVSDISSFNMQFFCCKTPSIQTDADKKPELGVWLDSWDMKYKMQPQLVKIRLALKPNNQRETEESILISCLIPRGFPVIEYGN